MSPQPTYTIEFSDNLGVAHRMHGEVMNVGDTKKVVILKTEAETVHIPASAITRATRWVDSHLAQSRRETDAASEALPVADLSAVDVLPELVPASRR